MWRENFFNTYKIIQKGSDPLVSEVGPGSLWSSTRPVSTRYLIASATLFYRHVTLWSNHFISSTSPFQLRWRDSWDDWTDKKRVRLNKKVCQDCAWMYVKVHTCAISIVSISKAGLKAAALDAGHETFSLPYVFRWNQGPSKAAICPSCWGSWQYGLWCYTALQVFSSDKTD